MTPGGIFINFEGIDGCGKTTQMRRLAARLRARGREVVEAIEPGGTAIGQKIRRILLDKANQNLFPTAELLLYFASRAQNVDEVINPALAAGCVVLADRFTDSTLAYQGYGRGLGAAAVAAVDRVACRGLQPHLTVLVDIDLETSLARAHARNAETQSNETRLDEESNAFHQRVRDAYLSMAAAEPGRFRVVDGRTGFDELEAAIWKVVEPHV